MCFCVTAKSWIMPDVGHLDPGFVVSQFAVPVDEHDRDVVAGFAARLVTEGEQLAGFGIDLRMRGERQALSLPPKV